MTLFDLQFVRDLLEELTASKCNAGKWCEICIYW